MGSILYSHDQRSSLRDLLPYGEHSPLSRSTSVLRLALGGRSPLPLGKRSPLLGNLCLALGEHSPLGTRQAFYASCLASVIVLHSRGAFSFLLGSTLSTRRAFSTWRSTSVLRFAFGERYRSPLTESILLSLGISARHSLGERSPLRVRKMFYIYDRRSPSSHVEHSPLHGIYSLWGSTLCARRAFFPWHSHGERSPLGARRAFSASHSVGVLHLRSAIALLSRGAFSSPRDLHSLGIYAMRSASVLCLALTRRAFSAWRSTSVLRFSFGGRSTFTIGDRPPLTGSILLSLGIYALRSASVLRLALTRWAFSAWHLLGGRSPLGTRGAFSASHSASVLYWRSMIVLLS
ncbi:hypothetical protein COLO4_28796 [Corchorus olitorius]|uniref:Uncharacterized protein n=1 Tax=Corchorus olitorius TaxID=93759 RepID=A0A1R3HI79_9ROSI|nr:hypothetical protein COLO4_28796 [Corchorus olitorius]